MVRAWRFRFIVTTLVMSLPSTSSAEWIPNGVPLVELPNQQSRPAVVSDGAGGVVVAWDDARVSNAWDVYGQRLDRWGDVLWMTNGAPICECTGYQTSPVLVSDGQGGAIVAWRHNETGAVSDGEIWARRIDTNGAVVWNAEVTFGVSYPGEFVMTDDGAGGAQFAWVSQSGTNVYARRVASTGQPAWLPTTVPIAVAPYEQWSPRIVPHADGGMLIAWVDRRRSYDDPGGDFIIVTDLYAQRVGTWGAIEWGANGTPVDLDGISGDPAIVADDVGGAFLVWNEGENILAHRIDANGAAVWPAAVVVSGDPHSQLYPGAIPDGNGGIFVVWSDDRNGNEDVLGQRLDGSGNPLWTLDGMALEEGPNATSARPIALPGGGFLLLIGETAAGKLHQLVQRYSQDGVPAWTPGGVRFSSLDIPQFGGGATLDGTGGVVVTFWEARTTSWDIYAQRFDLVHGAWGHPEAELASVVDTPDDQGGTVTMNWLASGREAGTDPLVVTYSIWRRVTPGAQSRTTMTDAWEQVLQVDATGQSEYQAVVPTTADSEPGFPVSNDFVVRAENVDPAVYWESNVVSGSSIDNTPLAVAITSFEAKERDGAVVLSAEFRSDLGVEFVNVYRGNGDEPVSLRESRVLSGDRFEYLDANVEAGSTYRYQLGVGDADGEFFSALATVTVLGLTAALGQNHPNPFNPTTTIRYTLPARERVALTVFDADGRRVRSLVDETQGGGQHEATWDGRDQNGTAVGSGVYFYRLTAGKFSASKKMVLLK